MFPRARNPARFANFSGGNSARISGFSRQCEGRDFLEKFKSLVLNELNQVSLFGMAGAIKEAFSGGRNKQRDLGSNLKPVCRQCQSSIGRFHRQTGFLIFRVRIIRA